ncbi:MAG TPA: hypothetical protein PKZ76_13095 [Xanthomonadaceae bacterium]|nr:hypothetical protein [Xanthomonadaceae bacterium]
MFLLLLVVVYWTHVRHFPVGVVFYAALSDVFISATVCTAALWVLRWFAVLGALEKVQLTVIWLLAGYALAISVPTVIDRSLSFYVLEKLDQRGGGIRADAFEQLFTQEYMKEHRLVDVRLTEQLESGTIEIEDGCVVLTDRGRRLARFSRSFRLNFLPRKRLLMGDHTDDLTDPFRASAPEVDYVCKPTRP